MNTFHRATEQQSGIKRFCCQPCVECKVVCLTSVKELALYHWKWLLCHGSWGSIIPSRLWTTDRSSGAAAARRSKCRAGKKTSKGPPEALWFMEAHRKRFKFEERWGYCHLFMRTSQPMIMGCHDFCWRILILNCFIWYDMIQCVAMRQIGYNAIWYDMMRYDMIRYDKVW